MRISTNRTKAISLLIMLMLSVTPLLFLRKPLSIPLVNYIIIDWFMQPKLIFLFIIAIMILIVLLINKKEVPISTKERFPEYILCIYVFLLLLSTLFSINPYISLVGAPAYNEGLITIFLYIFLYQVTRKYYSYSNNHLHAIMISSFLLSIYGILQYLGYDLTKTFMTGTVYASFRNPNYFAAYLVLVLPIPIFQYIKTRSWYYLLLVSLLYFCLLATNTRGSWIGFFFALVTLFYFSFKLKYQTRRLVVILVLLVIITIFFNIVNDGNTRARLLSIFKDFRLVMQQSDGYENAGSQRILIWKYAIEFIKENPLLGTGIETFGLLTQEDFIFKVHNEYLSIAQSSGIPSLLVYLAWLGYVIKRGIDLVPEKKIALPFLASVIGYATQAFFNVSVVAVAFIFWCFCGILSSFDKKTIKKDQM